MITLGLNAAFHDSAAALVIDGVPVAAAEEERFTRIKHAKRPLPFTAWELPFHAIASCLEHAGLTMADVASAVGCPLQTAYSRLHAARAHVQESIQRMRTRDEVAQ